MKLNIDCVRDLLLTIESEVNFTEDLKYLSVNINSLCESDFFIFPHNRAVFNGFENF